MARAYPRNTDRHGCELYQGKYRIEPARLRAWDYRSRGWYFVTICTHNRASLFGKVVDQQMQLSRIGRIAASELQMLPSHYDNVTVDESVVMPNHVHAIIAIDGEHCYSPTTLMKLPFPNTACAFRSAEGRILIRDNPVVQSGRDEKGQSICDGTSDLADPVS